MKHQGQNRKSTNVLRGLIPWLPPRSSWHLRSSCFRRTAADSWAHLDRRARRLFAPAPEHPFSRWKYHNATSGSPSPASGVMIVYPTRSAATPQIEIQRGLTAYIRIACGLTSGDRTLTRPATSSFAAVPMPLIAP